MKELDWKLDVNNFSSGRLFFALLLFMFRILHVLSITFGHAIQFSEKHKEQASDKIKLAFNLYIPCSQLCDIQQKESKKDRSSTKN